MSPRAALAHHEAGHAVAVLALGGWLERVTIAPVGDLGGHVAWSPRGPQGHLDALVVALAGPAATARYLRRPCDLEAHRHDLRAVKRVLLAHHGHAPARRVDSPLYRRALNRAWRIVNSRWPAIAGVAALLLDRETVAHDEVLAAACPNQRRTVA